MSVQFTYCEQAFNMSSLQEWSDAVSRCYACNQSKLNAHVVHIILLVSNCSVLLDEYDTI